MPKVIGIKFKTTPRVYYFAPQESDEYKKGDVVVVETQRGEEFATVAMPVTEVADDQIVSPLKQVGRKATESDLNALAADNDKKQEILATAKQKVQDHKLDMKIVDCEFTVDHSKLVLYFTAEQRVDFRELVRDLASAFRMRIDLRQIGSRDECKLIGTLGACGQPCCCKRFESDGEHISIKMAKNQGLALNPSKINGMCGRLMCCLAYENKTYDEIIKRMPKHGAQVTAPDGRAGVVVSSSILAEKVKVRFGDDENFEFAEFPLEELSFEKREGGGQSGNNGNNQSDNNVGNKNNKTAKPKKQNREQRNSHSAESATLDLRSDNNSFERENKEKTERTEKNGGKNRNRNNRKNRRGDKKHDGAKPIPSDNRDGEN